MVESASPVESSSPPQSETGSVAIVLTSTLESVAMDPIALGAGQHTVGADPRCDVVLPGSGIAARHCLIVVGPHRTVVKSLSPLTWINDEPVQEAPLQPGDRVTLGPLEFRASAADATDDPTAGPRSAELQELHDEAAARHELHAAAEAAAHDVERFQSPAIDRGPDGTDEAEDVQTAPAGAQQAATREVLSQERAAIEQSRAALQQQREHLNQLAESLDQRDQELNRRQGEASDRDEQLQQEQKRLDDLASRLEQDRNDLDSERAAQSAERERIEAEQQRLQGELAELQQQRDALVHQQDDLARQSGELAQAEVALQGREEDLGRQKEQLTQAEQAVDAREEEVSRRSEELTQTEQALHARERELSDRSVQFAQREETLRTQEEDLSRRKDELAQAEQTQQSREEDLARRTAELTQTEEALRSREQELDERSRSLEQEVDRVKQSRNELNDDRTAFEQERETLTSETRELEERSRNLGDEQQVLIATRAAMRLEQERLQQRRQEVEDRETQLAEMEAALQNGREALARDREEMERESAAMLAQRAELETQRAQVDSDRAQLDELQSRLAAERRDLDNERQALEQSRAAPDGEQATPSSADTERDELASALERERAQMQQERVALQCDREALDAQRQELEQARAALDEERARRDEQGQLDRTAVESIEEDRNRLVQEQEALHQDRERLLAQQREAEEARQQLEEERAKLAEERDAWEREQRTTAGEARDDLGQMQDLAAEQQRLETLRNELEAERAQFEADRADLHRQLAEFSTVQQVEMPGTMDVPAMEPSSWNAELPNDDVPDSAAWESGSESYEPAPDLSTPAASPFEATGESPTSDITTPDEYSITPGEPLPESLEMATPDDGVGGDPESDPPDEQVATLRSQLSQLFGAYPSEVQHDDECDEDGESASIAQEEPSADLLDDQVTESPAGEATDFSEWEAAPTPESDGGEFLEDDEIFESDETLTDPGDPDFPDPAGEYGDGQPPVDSLSEEDAEASATEEVEEEENSIADYMERLLGRSSVRRPKPAPLPEVLAPVVVEQDDEGSREEDGSQEEEGFQEDAAPEAMDATCELEIDMSALRPPVAETESSSPPDADGVLSDTDDQLRRAAPDVPKEVLRANLDSFRELANMSARTAVAQHASKRLWSTIQLKVAVTGVGLAVTATLIAAEVMGIGTFLVWTTISGLITFGALVELTRTLISYFRWQSIEEGGSWGEQGSPRESGASQELQPADD